MLIRSELWYRCVCDNCRRRYTFRDSPGSGDKMTADDRPDHRYCSLACNQEGSKSKKSLLAAEPWEDDPPR